MLPLVTEIAKEMLVRTDDEHTSLTLSTAIQRKNGTVKKKIPGRITVYAALEQLVEQGLVVSREEHLHNKAPRTIYEPVRERINDLERLAHPSMTFDDFVSLAKALAQVKVVNNLFEHMQRFRLLNVEKSGDIVVTNELVGRIDVLEKSWSAFPI